MKNSLNRNLSDGFAFKEHKNRFDSLGEVFTPKFAIDLIVKQAGVDLESIVFEPGCGEGNFAIEILAHKFDLLNRLVGKKTENFEKNSLPYKIIKIVASIYQNDIDLSNLSIARQRIVSFVYDYAKKMIKDELAFNTTMKIVKCIVANNLFRADLLQVNSRNRVKIVMYKFIESEQKIIRVIKKLEDLMIKENVEQSIFASDLSSDTKDAVGITEWSCNISESTINKDEHLNHCQ